MAEQTDTAGAADGRDPRCSLTTHQGDGLAAALTDLNPFVFDLTTARHIRCHASPNRLVQRGENDRIWAVRRYNVGERVGPESLIAATEEDDRNPFHPQRDESLLGEPV